MKCKYCGNDISDDSIFCEFCGNQQTTYAAYPSFSSLPAGNGQVNRKLSKDDAVVFAVSFFFMVGTVSNIADGMSASAIVNCLWVVFSPLLFRFYLKLPMSRIIMLVIGGFLIGLSVNHILFNNIERGKVELIVAIFLLLADFVYARFIANDNLYGVPVDDYEYNLRKRIEKRIVIIMVINLIAIAVCAVISIPKAKAYIENEKIVQQDSP